MKKRNIGNIENKITYKVVNWDIGENVPDFYTLNVYSFSFTINFLPPN